MRRAKIILDEVVPAASPGVPRIMAGDVLAVLSNSPQMQSRSEVMHLWRRLDVLVQAEKIGRIKSRFELGKPRVFFRSIGV